jgi:hypothetical protein
MSHERIDLEEARKRLKDLGYLNGRVERMVFRRAFEGRGGLFLPAVVLGAVGGALACLAAVDAGEPGFRFSPAALSILALHMAAADLFPAALIALALAWWADRSRAPSAAGTAAGLGAAAVLFLLWIGGVWSLSREIPPLSLLWALPVGAAALWLARSTRSGFLARAYAHSRILPARPPARIFLLATALATVFAAMALLASRPAPIPVPPPRPSPRGSPVVVVGIDGLSLDTAAGVGWTGLRELLGKGRTGWWPARVASPPEIWTDLATGASASRHGVRALARIRPLGSPLALRPPFGTAWYLRGAAPRLGLATTAPVSSRDRGSLAFWEVAASAGLPALSIGWWASGLWPGAEVISNEEILARASDGVAADRESMAAFRHHPAGPAIAAVYLPGLDILRGDQEKRGVDEREIQTFLEDEVSAAVAGQTALVVLCIDSHPQPGALGRMVVFDGPGPWSMMRIRPEDVAVSILARAGIPAARDLAGRPAGALFRPGSLETGTVASYGPRLAPAAPRTRESDREYLEKLKSLGYLQ